MIHRTTGSEHTRVPLRFGSWRPAGAAASLVHSFYLFGYPDAGAAMPVSGLIVPDGQVEVGVVLSGAFFERRGAGWTPLPAVYADRILTEATTIRCEPDSLLLAAKLKFGAAVSVLGCPASALANREALADVVGPWVQPAIEAVRDAVRLREAVHRFEALLDDLTAAAGDPDPIVEHAARRLAAADLRIGALETETAMSSRALEMRFRRSLGMSPKRFARIRRIRRLITALARAPHRRQVDCALEAGFFDQSHLVREFRAVTGLAPCAFFRAQAFVSDLLETTSSADRASDSSKTGSAGLVQDDLHL